MNDLEHELRELLDERSRDTRAGTSPTPKVLRRARRRQVWTVLGTVATVVAVVGGSIAGVSALLRADRDPVVTNPDSAETRTSTINGVTVTYPAGWYLLAFPENDALIQLTNFDPASTVACFSSDGVDLPVDGVQLLLMHGTLDDALPRWPVPLRNDTGPRHCPPAGVEIEHPPDVAWRQIAEWANRDGTVPYRAWLVNGPTATSAARAALVSAFESLSVRDPRDADLIDSPVYVLTSGNGWNFVATTSREEGPDLSVLVERTRVGSGAFTVPETGHLESASRTIGGTTFVWGAASFDVESMHLETDAGAGTVELVDLPPSFEVPFRAFVGSAPAGTEWKLTVLDADGHDIERHGGRGAVAEPRCPYPNTGDIAERTPFPDADAAQRALRNALAAAMTFAADCGGYKKLSPEALAAIEPTFSYATDPVSSGVISVRGSAATVVLATVDEQGNTWCIANDQERGETTMGNTDARTFDQCTGGWEPQPAMPEQAHIEHGGTYWAVYVAIGSAYDDPDVQAAEARVRDLGYTPGGGGISCDDGAREALGVDTDRERWVVGVYFHTRGDADAFAALLDAPPVGIARVTTYCLD